MNTVVMILLTLSPYNGPHAPAPYVTSAAVYETNNTVCTSVDGAVCFGTLQEARGFLVASGCNATEHKTDLGSRVYVCSPRTTLE